jgi:hypothetical protein
MGDSELLPPAVTALAKKASKVRRQPTSVLVGQLVTP